MCSEKVVLICQLLQNARSILFNGAAHKSGLFQCKDGNWDIREKCNSDHIMTVMVMQTPKNCILIKRGNALFNPMLAFCVYMHA